MKAAVHTWWWSDAEDGRPGRPLALPTMHLSGKLQEYVRDVVNVRAFGKRWQLIVRHYQTARWQGDLKTTLAPVESVPRRGKR